MTLNRVKLGRGVKFMKCLARLVFLTFLAKTSIWHKITFPASNSLNLAGVVVIEPMKSIYKKIYQYSIFYSNLSLFNVKMSRAFNKRTR